MACVDLTYCSDSTFLAAAGAAAGEASTEEADENVVDAEFEKVEDEK